MHTSVLKMTAVCSAGLVIALLSVFGDVFKLRDNVCLSNKYRVSQKKMSFLGKIAITTLKLIQNANVGGVLENSGYLLPHGH